MKKIIFLFFISMTAVPGLAQPWKITYNMYIHKDDCERINYTKRVQYSYYFNEQANRFNSQTAQSGHVENQTEAVTIIAGGEVKWECCVADGWFLSWCDDNKRVASFNVQSPSNGCSQSSCIWNGSHYLNISFDRIPIPAPTVTPPSCTSNTVTCRIESKYSARVQWQYSGTSQGPWRNFGTNSHTVTGTVDNFLIPDSPKYGNRFVRVVDPNCRNANGAFNVVSGIATFKFSAPGPTITCTPIPPNCYNGTDGSIRVNISSAPGINSFVVNLYRDGEGIQFRQLPITNSSSATLTGIPAGDYLVEVQNNTSTSLYGACPSAKVRVTVANPSRVTVFLIPSRISLIPPNRDEYNTNPPQVRFYMAPQRDWYNISCHGGSDGTLQAIVYGGTGNYTEYSWTPANISQGSLAASLRAGDYSVTVKDSKGCQSESSSKTLTEPPALSVSLRSTGGKDGYDVSCHDKSDGRLEAEPAGGAGAYSYAWSGGAGTETGNVFSSLRVGTYTVTVTDGNGCTASDSKALAAPTAIGFAINRLPESLNCPNDVTTLSSIGLVHAIGSVNYRWSSGETAESISGKGPGNYSLTVSDEQGCSTTKSVTMNTPEAYTVTLAAISDFNGKPIQCHGGNNGVIEAAVKSSLGTVASPSNYVWKKNNIIHETGKTKNKITGLAAGSYVVEVTYNGNCAATSNTLSLSAPPQLSVAVRATSSHNGGSVISCHGASDASLKAAAAGGIAPYIYEWNTQAVASALSGLPEGTYSVTAKDKNECTASNSITLTAPLPIGFDIRQLTTLNCQDDATASFQVQNITHAIGTVSYRWSSGETAESISGKKAGTYSATVSANGCRVTKSVSIADPVAYTVTLAAASHFNGRPIKCHGESNGVIAATVRNGEGVAVSASNYAWKKNDVAFQEGPAKNSISNLSKGNYAVEVTYNDNCKSTSNTFLLTEPDPVTVAIRTTSDYRGSVISCHGKSDASLEAVVTGGTAPYAYEWNTQAVASALSGLPEGTYSVTAKDKNECQATDDVTLTAPPSIDFSIRQLTRLSCPSETSASFQVQNLVNTFGTVSYRWSSGETAESISGKGSGIYSLTTSDEKGCSVTKSIRVSEPEAYTAVAAATSNFNGSLIKCNGGSNGVIDATVRNGQGDIVQASYYEWTKNSAAFEEGSTKNRISNLSRGDYAVEITYNNNCKTISNTFPLTDPDPIAVTVRAISNYHGAAISCHGSSDASLEAYARGGTGYPSYSYRWSTGGNTSSVSGLPEGTYSATVLDRNNCSGEGEIVIRHPTPVQAEAVSSSDYAGYGVTCLGASDGFINVIGRGGTGALSYAWSNGSATPHVAALAAGAYSVTVKDANQCSAALSKIITAPTVLQTSVAFRQDIACAGGNDGRIELSAAGGAGSYQYSNDNGASWQASPAFASLTAGAYSLRVKDVNRCFKNIAAALSEPRPLDISFTNIEPSYCRDPRGKATASVQGGVSEYSYAWKNSLQEILSRSEMLSRAIGGEYTLTVTDAHHCSASKTVSITSTDGAGTSYTSINAKCHDSSDGSALISILSGNGPFRVKWPDNQSALQAVNLKRGVYSVLITDVNDCAVVQDVEVRAPEPLQLELQSQTPPSCHSFCDGAMTLTASGGTGAYSCQWNGSAGVSQSGLCASVYPVLLQDANGCRLNKSFTLREPGLLTVKTASITLPSCADGCDGALEAQGEGGNGGYRYVWDNGAASPSRRRSCPGTYSVTVTDAKGCAARNSFTLGNVPPAPLNLGDNVTLCLGQSHRIDAGNGWTSVRWTGDNNFTSVARAITVTEAGEYKATALGERGCRAEGSLTVRTSNKTLNAKFALAAQAFAGDTIVIVDLTWPLPEKIEWSWPAEMTKIVSSDSVAYVKFNKAGVYDIGMLSRLGECRRQTAKRIAILEKENKAPGGRLGHKPFVEQFEAYPNPNHGYFQTLIVLAENSPAALKVWNAVDSKPIQTIFLSGDKTYRVFMDLQPLSAGVYVLRLEHAKGTESLRFMVR